MDSKTSFCLGSHLILLFLVFLDEFLLFFDTTFASHEKENHQHHNETQQNDTPDDDVSAHSSLGAPEQEGDH